MVWKTIHQEHVAAGHTCQQSGSKSRWEVGLGCTTSRPAPRDPHMSLWNIPIQTTAVLWDVESGTAEPYWKQSWGQQVGTQPKRRCRDTRFRKLLQETPACKGLRRKGRQRGQE